MVPLFREGGRAEAALKLTHLREDGSLTMVDVAAKPATERLARARATLLMSQPTAAALRDATLKKGDAFSAAQLAGILAAKRTGELIPLAHSIALSSVDVDFVWHDERTLWIEATARTVGQTGVEMEALVAASIASLTLYDMVKALERGVRVESLRLIEKSGGRSGAWRAPDV